MVQGSIDVDKDVQFSELNKGGGGVGVGWGWGGMEKDRYQNAFSRGVWYLMGGCIYYVKISNAIWVFFRTLFDCWVFSVPTIIEMN